jgi:predicted acyltransferase
MNVQPARLISLDALRGFTIALMIVVNYPGSENAVFFTLRHTVWNGLSLTDEVAPFFLFIVGVSVVFAFSKKLHEGTPKTGLYKKIIFRALKIYAVGMFLNLMPQFDLHTIRWTGTLQRIAIVYLLCGIIFLHTGWKQQVWIASILLIAYWLVLNYIPTPGAGRVMLEPGINVVAWLDNRWLPGRMWRGNWDPESILTTVTSVVSGITGMLAGRLMLSNYSANEKVNILMTSGVFSAMAGYFWGLAFPVNENLWTSSFVLVTSGFAALLFGAIYYLVDIKGRKTGTLPFIMFGANAITVYFLADVWALVFYLAKFGGVTLNDRAVQDMIHAGCDPRLASLLYVLFFLCINFIPAWLLYRKKIFIKL